MSYDKQASTAHATALMSAREQTLIAKHNYDTQLQICKSNVATADDFKLLAIYRNEWRDLSEKGSAITNERVYKLRLINQ